MITNMTNKYDRTCDKQYDKLEIMIEITDMIKAHDNQYDKT